MPRKYDEAERKRLMAGMNYYEGRHYGTSLANAEDILTRRRPRRLYGTLKKDGTGATHFKAPVVRPW